MFSIPNFRCEDFNPANINRKSKDASAESKLEVLTSSLLLLSSQTFVLCTPTPHSLSLLSPFPPPPLVLQNHILRAAVSQLTHKLGKLTEGDPERKDLEELRSALAKVCEDVYEYLLASPGPRIYW